jgi:hypothetical protein
MSGPHRRIAIALAITSLATACDGFVSMPHAQWDPPIGAARPAEIRSREACDHHTATRSAWFGDLHVHTAFSMDARTRDLTLTPHDAYRYANGHRTLLPPLDAQGRGTVGVRIDRPLDFAAVTDHASMLGEVSRCMTRGSSAYDTPSCRAYRGETTTLVGRLVGGLAGRLTALGDTDGRNVEICGEDGHACRAALKSAWQATWDAAEHWYDRTSACRFTTFHAWEHTATPGLTTKVHRNVILRNEIVPELPISAIDEPYALGLWRKLRDLCTETGTGCDALAIPHNPNLSNGRMFTLPYRDQPIDVQRTYASMRARYEPLVEMMQAKGDSECRNGFPDVLGGPDELCDFEKIRGLGDDAPRACAEGETDSGALVSRGCVSKLDYARYALVEGLREQARVGVNPYRMGFIASTDTHNAAPGAVEEASFFGTRGASSIRAAQRLSGVGTPPQRESVRNPGGLVGVWAEENSRESIFRALRRRETFGTSGPRIQPRFFAGYDLADEACDAEQLPREGYAGGVPMGGVVQGAAGEPGGPRFLVSALKDPEGPDLLQRIQIIKGWVDDDGAFHQAVHDVAGAANDADVDLASCTPRGAGHARLCATWTDPEFDAERLSVYYARVVQNPTCRWSTAQCLAYAEDDAPPACSDPSIPRTVQERAWTSPIWYEPPA